MFQFYTAMLLQVVNVSAGMAEIINSMSGYYV
jgi:hypothetical protein